jgi:hypothetical protein
MRIYPCHSIDTHLFSCTLKSSGESWPRALYQPFTSLRHVLARTIGLDKGDGGMLMETAAMNRVNMKLLQSLIDRMNAKKNPILEEQTRRFAKHPDGSVSDLCVSVRRVPNACGRTVASAERLPITDLMATPNGEPCILTVMNSMHTVVCGDVVYMLLPDKKGKETKTMRVDLLGFATDGKPLTYVYGICDEPFAVPPFYVFHGDKGLYKNEEGFHGATVLKNGDLVYCLDDGKRTFLYRNEEIVAEREGVLSAAPVQFHELHENRFVCLEQCDASGAPPYRLTTFLEPNQTFGRKYVDVRMTNTGLLAITSDCCVDDPFATKGELFFTPESTNPFGNNPYLAELKKLPDGRIAYIGESTRDHLRCIVVDKKEQPGFDLVSGLFERNGVCMYYGIIGYHLYTMEIPPL